jgi:guanine deaminase
MKQGQRAFVGKVNMDRMSPENYTETTQESLQNTRAFIHDLKSLNSPLLQPVITPRFLPTCTPELLKGLKQIADENPGILIQSHLSESQDEMAFTQSLFPDQGTDAQIFDAVGLLSKKTVMAHAVHLSESDTQLLKERGVGIAVCPLSNAYFAGGRFPLETHLHKLNKCGLGSDVAGGYSPSLLNAMRTSVLLYRASLPHPEGLAVNHHTAFWLATRGGARVLGMEGRVGGFEEGFAFDAVLVDVGNPCDTVDTHNDGAAAAGNVDSGLPFDVFFEYGQVRLQDEEGIRNVFEKWINLGDDRNIKGVWIEGKQVL